MVEELPVLPDMPDVAGAVLEPVPAAVDDVSAGVVVDVLLPVVELASLLRLQAVRDSAAAAARIRTDVRVRVRVLIFK
jgi:hypothetical protein